MPTENGINACRTKAFRRRRKNGWSMTLGALYAASEGLDSKQFSERFSWPFLLHEDTQSVIEVEGGQTMSMAYMPTSTDAREARSWVVYELRGPEHSIDVLSLGRAESNDVVLADHSVSKSHARLTVQPNKTTLLVTDLGSRNGTTYEGRRIGAESSAEVTSGAIVTFGRVPLRFLSVDQMFRYFGALKALQKL